MKKWVKFVSTALALVTILSMSLFTVSCKKKEAEKEPKTGLGYTIDQSKMFGICALPSDLFTSSADVGVTTDQI